MGSVAKVFKKASRVIKKPLSKITKGIARGIAKVGKSVMKGVSRLSKKLGPLGMIALSVAMPYALSGLSTMVGQAGVMHPLYGMSNATGFMGSQNVFLRSIGQVGNAIRTGYQASTGAIGKTWSTITKSIGQGFQKFTKGTGNIWTRISEGAKNLFNSARTTMKKYTPKFRAGQSGSVDVFGLRGNVHGEGLIKTSLRSADAASMLKSGAIDASQLSGQSLGSAEGWFTQAGSAEADNLITQTINNAVQPRIDMLDKDALRYFNDNVAFQKNANSYVNHSNSLDSVMNNKATSYNGITDFDGSYSTDLMKTGDYTKISTTAPGTPTEYTFTGENTYNNNVGKSSINRAKKVKKSNIAKSLASTYASSLLTPSSFKHPNVMYASAADMTQQTTAGYGGTDIQGSWGGSLLQGAFDDNQRERIMNYYKNMNIIGSH